MRIVPALLAMEVPLRIAPAALAAAFARGRTGALIQR